MSSHFSRSLRTLEADSPRRNAAFFAILLCFVGVWLAWFAVARVAVYASTGAARIEVDRENHPVDAAVEGRVVAVRVRVGQVVEAGDVLVEFDAISQRLSRDEEQARLAPAASQLALLKEEFTAQQRALEGDRRSAQAAIAQTEVAVQRARSAADFAAEESNRLTALQRRSLVSELDALRAMNVVAERQNDAQSAELASRRLARDMEAREQDRLAQLARLKREIAAIEGTRAEAVATAQKLGYDIELRTVRAPVAGRVAEVTPLTPGTVVTSGTRVCTIVPEGILRVVAFFPPAVALGRIRVGQSARVRLEGFPWTQYGSPTAHVSSVSGEPRDGTIRVELTLDNEERSSIPMQHGLPAEIDIEVERMSPAALVMRSIGVQTRLAAAER